MHQPFIDKFLANKEKLSDEFKKEHPTAYKSLVHKVVSLLQEDDEYEGLDPERIHEINDGDYQGTLIYVIAEKGYQPNDYWFVKVGYGSCSGCDTLEAIREYSDNPPSEDQIKDYMTLALHIVEGLKPMQES